MSLRRAFRSRKFSKSFRELKSADDEDQRQRQLVRVDSSSPSSWSSMLPELLGEIMRRVEAGEDRWPERRNVVACACVCKRWRDVAKEIARSPSRPAGKITFPSCLKQVSLLSLSPFVVFSSFVVRTLCRRSIAIVTEFDEFHRMSRLIASVISV